MKEAIRTYEEKSLKKAIDFLVKKGSEFSLELRNDVMAFMQDLCPIHLKKLLNSYGFTRITLTQWRLVTISEKAARPKWRCCSLTKYGIGTPEPYHLLKWNLNQPYGI